MTRQLDMYDNADPLIGNEVNLLASASADMTCFMSALAAARTDRRLRRSGPTTTLTPL
jgi:hypothetical protein